MRFHRCVLRVKPLEEPDAPSQLTYFPCGGWLGHNDHEDMPGGPLSLVLEGTDTPPEVQRCIFTVITVIIIIIITDTSPSGAGPATTAKRSTCRITNGAGIHTTPIQGLSLPTVTHSHSWWSWLQQRGEDAYFLCNGDSICSLGVSDGVGEWARDGIDSGEFARGLMRGAKRRAVDTEDRSTLTIHPTALLLPPRISPRSNSPKNPPELSMERSP